jgi:serine/threonine protein phosphatase 1
MPAHPHADPLKTPSAPSETRIYAIGDIHGRLDLIERLHQEIRTDIIGCKSKRKLIVYLGDYIDRGFHSREVIDYLISNPMQGFETIYIKGNHEYAMQLFMGYPDKMAAWLNWGGASTLQSYGVNFYTAQNTMKSLKLIAEELSNGVPQSHKDFLHNLHLFHAEGDYLFVHAGIRPGKDLRKQTIEDLTMIRDEFIYSPVEMEYRVVFGHSIFETPFVQKDKVGVDTGAYFSGKLTAAVIEGAELRFIST